VRSLEEATVMRRMLVAGVGNIFLSDDGFGVEVVRHLLGRPRPDGVEIADFGIRGVHLAYRLLEGYDVLVLVDAAPRGHPPGTVTLVEVDQRQLAQPDSAVASGASPLVDAHGMDPAMVLTHLAALGGQVASVLIVACEPETIEEGIGLSAAVRAAVPEAVVLVEQVIRENDGSPKEVTAL
jgi:hydrogenase maturation protease